MKKKLLLLCISSSLALHSVAQLNDSLSFNEISLPQEGFWNGKGGNGGVEINGLFFRNAYDNQFDSWSGWAFSKKTDSVSAGFGNQYSCIAGKGASGISNDQFALGYFFEPLVIRLKNRLPFKPISAKFTNSTYAYKSMKSGDAFSKKFGGTSGNDPDFFRLIIKAMRNGSIFDSAVVSLADYTFSNSNQDYIQREWLKVNLSNEFGNQNVDSLMLFLRSSDANAGGILTPAYFCMDDFITSPIVSTYDILSSNKISIFPNPAKEFISISSKSFSDSEFTIQIIDDLGKVVMKNIYDTMNEKINLNIANIPSGMYTVFINGKDFRYVSRFIKE